jgi:hypothetical protein
MALNPYRPQQPVNAFAVAPQGQPKKALPLFNQNPPKSDALANALMQSAYASQPQSPFDAVGKLAMLWSGKRQKDRYLEGQEAKERAPFDALREALQGGGDIEAALLASEDPSLFTMGLEKRMTPAERWEDTDINGMPGQRNSVSGKFDPFPVVKPDVLSPEAEAQKLRLARAGSTNVNVGAGEKAWDTESAKLFAKRYDDIATQAQSANEMLGLYDVASMALNSGLRTGTLGSEEQAIRRLGQIIGVGDADTVAAGELLTSIQNRMALMMRSPDSGMGMPGAVSDRDLIFLKDAQIGLDRSEEGNRLMLDAFRRLEQRKIEIAQLADEYVRNNHQLDSGFYAEVRQYAEANPLFDDVAASGGANGASGALTPEQEAQAQAAGYVRGPDGLWRRAQ